MILTFSHVLFRYICTKWKEQICRKANLAVHTRW